MGVLVISGSVQELPAGGVLDLFDERIGLVREAEKRVIVLTQDAAHAVDLDGGTQIHAIHITTDSKITARITTADGAQQLIPVDPLLVLVSRSVPITAIDLVRVAGQTATVAIIIGQKN